MTETQTGEVRGLVRVTNVGRRPVFVAAAALDIPDSKHNLLLMNAVSGAKLGEGDKPAGFFVSHASMKEHAAVWRKIRAYVELSTGERFYSKHPRKDALAPAWVSKPGVP